ncbi:cyclin-like protein [Mycena leptocephala]|nr:cyclin-like protein [Mycena leptocephala]
MTSQIHLAALSSLHLALHGETHSNTRLPEHQSAHVTSRAKLGPASGAANGVSGSTLVMARVASGKTAKRKGKAPPNLNGGNRKIRQTPRGRSSNGRCLIPHLRREKQVHTDDQEPIPKGQRILNPDMAGNAEPEATQHGDLWEDLEGAEFDDPQWRATENHAQPKLHGQPAEAQVLTWEMRAVLNDRLIQGHTRFRLTPETLFLCINLIDRFLSTRVTSPSQLQLVGMACLFIASNTEILQEEQRILCTLDWDLSYPGPLNYVRSFFAWNKM